MTMACSVTRIMWNLDAAMSELEHYTGNVWTHILSLHREDAERLGYNSAQAWRALIRAHRNDIAAAMHIRPRTSGGTRRSTMRVTILMST